jgi:hypothetical protein
MSVPTPPAATPPVAAPPAGPPTEPAQTPPPATDPQTQGDPADLGEAGKKALTAEREARKAAEKSAADLAAQLKAVEDAKLSDLERAQATAKEAQDQLATITRQNLRNSVALTKGVPADLVDFLTGDTEQEIAAKADVLMARLQAPGSPRADLSQAATRNPAAAGTPEADFAQFLNSQLG